MDGDFGPLTHARVVEFQKSNQLTADGIVGPRTMAKLFEEEQLPITLALVPQQVSTFGVKPRGIQPPRLIPPLTLPPLTPPVVTPFFLPPDSSSRIPVLTPAGRDLPHDGAGPQRSGRSCDAQLHRDHAAPRSSAAVVSFPRRDHWRRAETRPESRASRARPGFAHELGFQWGVKPVFDFKSIGPPIQFAVGGAVNARYVLKLIDKPGATVPQLGLFVQGDFRGTIDWTSQAAESRPQLDLKGSFLGGVGGRF